MSPHPLEGVSLRSRNRILLLLISPVLLGSAFVLLAAAGVGPARPVDLERRASELAEWFPDWLRDELAPQAVADAFPASRAAGGPGGAALLEGVAMLDERSRVVDWIGVPAQPPVGFLDADGPRWRIRHDGGSTRLLVRLATDAIGRTPLVSFVLDSTAGNGSFAGLIPRPLRQGV